MPKNKTHSGTSKRLKVTGSGKLIRQQRCGMRHKLEKKPSKLTRRLAGTDGGRQARRQAGQTSCSVADPAGPLCSMTEAPSRPTPHP